MTVIQQRTTVGLVAFVLAGAIACQETTTSPATPAGDNASAPGGSAPTVALVMKSLANEFFQTMEDGARRTNNRIRRATS